MAGSRRLSIAIVVAAVVIAFAGAARAQALGAPPEVAVQISAGQPGTTIVVRGSGQELDCGERCDVTLPQGSYSMLVKDADGHRSTQRLDVVAPMHAVVTPPDHGTKVLGMTSAIVGVVAAAAGAATLLLALFLRAVERIDCNGMECTSDDVPSWMWYGGGISLAAGAVLGVTGLVLWRQNAHASVRVDAAVTPSIGGASLRLAPAAGARWAGLALTGAF